MQIIIDWLVQLNLEPLDRSSGRIFTHQNWCGETGDVRELSY